MKTKQGKSEKDIQLKEATYCRGDMFHSLAFLKQFWVLPNSHSMERKGKKLFPKNRKDILGKREKLRGHKSVGEFFDTCILRVRSPTLTRTLYPVIVVTRKPEEVKYVVQNYKPIHCRASTSGRRVLAQLLCPHTSVSVSLHTT